MLEEVQAVSDEAEEVPETEETGEVEKEQPADSNEQILELRRQGMSEVEKMCIRDSTINPYIWY